MQSQDTKKSPLDGQKVAILGYGNQGRAQALNLRDSGVSVRLGLRQDGPSAQRAQKDGFVVLDPESAVRDADLVVVLIPDEAIPELLQSLISVLSERPRAVLFSHGFAYHHRLIERLENCAYLLAAPKGAGTVLRESYKEGKKLPAAYAVENSSAVNDAENLCLAYAQAAGMKPVIRTTFEEETVCDLFGEQAVLCGGMLELMAAAVEQIESRGYRKEMAFYECVYEAKRILDVLLEHGPEALGNQISRTAFYGGSTRGPRVFGEKDKANLGKLFSEILDGKFADEWMNNESSFQTLTERFPGFEKAYRAWKKADQNPDKNADG